MNSSLVASVAVAFFLSVDGYSSSTKTAFGRKFSSYQLQASVAKVETGFVPQVVSDSQFQQLQYKPV